jgi:hypothetical protein
MTAISAWRPTSTSMAIGHLRAPATGDPAGYPDLASLGGGVTSTGAGTSGFSDAGDAQ